MSDLNDVAESRSYTQVDPTPRKLPQGEELMLDILWKLPLTDVEKRALGSLVKTCTLWHAAKLAHMNQQTLYAAAQRARHVLGKMTMIRVRHRRAMETLLDIMGEGGGRNRKRRIGGGKSSPPPSAYSVADTAAKQF